MSTFIGTIIIKNINEIYHVLLLTIAVMVSATNFGLTKALTYTVAYEKEQHVMNQHSSTIITLSLMQFFNTGSNYFLK